jgi:hypothetical protein
MILHDGVNEGVGDVISDLRGTRALHVQDTFGLFCGHELLIHFVYKYSRPRLAVRHIM